jgi:hypothetical protein
MVAILQCGGDVADRLERQAVFNEQVKYSEAWRYADWAGTDAHLALLVDEEGDVRWLGRAQGGRRLTSRDRIVHVSEIEEVEPTPFTGLGDRLPAIHRKAVERWGILPEGAGSALIQVLSGALPGYEELIRRLGRPADTRLPPNARGELLGQQRDAVGLLLDIGLGGDARKTLRNWDVPPVDAPFLAGMADYPAHEDHLIKHDTERFTEWVNVPSVRAGWHVFSQGRKKMFVMDANRTSVEATLGVDVVYFNEARDSFVLVQYKKMTREYSQASGDVYYRPDSGLTAELERMRKVDQLCTQAPGEFRLLETACWLKLCKPTPQLDPAKLVDGMYFARSHFEELLDTCRGPKGGTRIGYDNTPRHLTNTMFTDLVSGGWIGSRGPGTDEIRKLIRESLETRHAIVVGIQQDGS